VHTSVSVEIGAFIGIIYLYIQCMAIVHIYVLIEMKNISTWLISRLTNSLIEKFCTSPLGSLIPELLALWIEYR
jgi:hypothetical protein